MQSSRYEQHLESLVLTGRTLIVAMQYECHPNDTKRQYEKHVDDVDDFVQGLPSFTTGYQPWYSEAKALIRQLLPDRLNDFVRHYEIPKSRKSLDFGSYVIEDYLHGTIVTKEDPISQRPEVLVSNDSAIPRIRQQVSIVESVKARFRSSLFDIRQLTQADLFDSEIDVSKELSKNGFHRAAGAVAGVVLERHLKEVCSSHKQTPRRRATINVLNDALKNGGVIDTPQWRFITHLGDLRNGCVHDNEAEPTKEDVADLLNGVSKVIKTVF